MLLSQYACENTVYLRQRADTTVSVDVNAQIHWHFLCMEKRLTLNDFGPLDCSDKEKYDFKSKGKQGANTPKKPSDLSSAM